MSASLCHPLLEAVLPQLSLHTQLGPLSVSEEDGALVALDWGWGRDQDATSLLRQAREQLHAYFDAELTRFSLPLAPVGTAYRQRVWLALADIPFGQTCSYGALAARLSSGASSGASSGPSSGPSFEQSGIQAVGRGGARAVGGAIGRNPLPIILPCHRVVGASGLGGYSAGDGVASKRALLRLEQRSIGHQRATASPAVASSDGPTVEAA